MKTLIILMFILCGCSVKSNKEDKTLGMTPKQYDCFKNHYSTPANQKEMLKKYVISKYGDKSKYLDELDYINSHGYSKDVHKISIHDSLSFMMQQCDATMPFSKTIILKMKDLMEKRDL